MKARFTSLSAALLALVLVFSGVGAVPAWAGPAQPWSPPGDNLFQPPATPDATKRTYPYREIKAADYDIPKWMLDLGGEYVGSLPSHDFYKTAAGKHDAGYADAYAEYVAGMDEHQPNAPKLTLQQFRESFLPGGWNHLITDWRDYKLSGRSWTWIRKRNNYISRLNNNQRGRAYERYYAAQTGVDAAHGFVVLDGKVPAELFDTPADAKVWAEKDYRVDGLRSVPGQRTVILELKSGKTVNRKQLTETLIPLAVALNADIVYGLGAAPNQATIDFLTEQDAVLRAALQKRWGSAPERAILGSTYRAQGVAQNPAGGGSGLQSGKQQSQDNTATEQLAGSPASPQEAADEASVNQHLADEFNQAPAVVLPQPGGAGQLIAATGADGEGMADDPDQLGGVDFSTLELRYISDTFAGAPGVKYSYSVDPAPGRKVSYGGADAAKLAADSFFVWLALPESAFTVNLNPEEPDRIVDEQFGRTDAGRVLLEADLQMKKTVAKLIHPDTGPGQRFWDDLRGKQSCISMRQWIVPAPATVRDAGAELFILKAPLQVKMETEYENLSGSQTCPGQATADTKHNESVFRKTILPKIVTAVNSAPEYADLRRVYASRVAAQWYRERSATKTTAYGDLVDSGDITAWVTEQDWKPKDTFDEYVRSYRDGEFKVKHTTSKGGTTYTNTYVYGGVDFTAAPTLGVGESTFVSVHPGVRTAVADLTGGPAADGEGRFWFGNETNELPLAEAYAMPPSPLSRPWIYLVALLPLLAWAMAGAVLIRRRRRVVR